MIKQFWERAILKIPKCFLNNTTFNSKLLILDKQWLSQTIQILGQAFLAKKRCYNFIWHNISMVPFQCQNHCDICTATHNHIVKLVQKIAKNVFKNLILNPVFSDCVKYRADNKNIVKYSQTCQKSVEHWRHFFGGQNWYGYAICWNKEELFFRLFVKSRIFQIRIHIIFRSFFNLIFE